MPSKKSPPPEHQRQSSVPDANHSKETFHSQGRYDEEVSGAIGANSGIPVVGIGGSAGALESFKSFLAAMPADSGAAFVIIQHLAPAHTSLLTEILAAAHDACGSMRRRKEHLLNRIPFMSFRPVTIWASAMASSTCPNPSRNMESGCRLISFLGPWRKIDRNGQSAFSFPGPDRTGRWDPRGPRHRRTDHCPG